MKKNKNNNPFESGQTNSNPFESGSNNPRPSVNQTTAGATFGKQKKSYSKIIIIIVIIVVIGVLIASNWWQVRYYFADRESIKNAQSVEIADNYKFDVADMGEEFKTNPFPTTLETGKSFTINQDDPGLIETEDYFELTLIAGKDFEPGVYTISSEGDVYIELKTSVQQYIDIGEGQTAYNIPFIPGDKLEIVMFEEDDVFTIDASAQTEYVNYQPNQEGIYVYGLSNDESQIEMGKNDYGSALYCYPSTEYDMSTQQCDYFFDEDITLNGGAGTYFAIDYRNEI